MADENQVVEQPTTQTESVPATPPAEMSIDQAADAFQALFDDDGKTTDTPTEQKPTTRNERGQFAKEGGEEVAETTAEDPAPEDWSEEQKAAYAALQPEHRAILSAADKARKTAIEAERAQYAEKLKAAEEYPTRLKDLEANYSKLGEIRGEKAELLVTLKREFSDIKSPEDRLALSDPNSQKYDVTRAQRFESLLRVGQELTQAEALADHNRKQALDAETLKDKQANEAKVYELIPEWGKLAKAGEIAKVRAELAEVRAHLKSVGLPAEEADALYSAHHIQVARESMLYRKALAEEAARKKAGAEKLQAAPRVQKPGAGRQQTAADEQVAALANRAHKSGRIEDVAAILERTIN
jgi:hypothetical protein